MLIVPIVAVFPLSLGALCVGEDSGALCLCMFKRSRDTVQTTLHPPFSIENTLHCCRDSTDVIIKERRTQCKGRSIKVLIGR